MTTKVSKSRWGERKEYPRDWRLYNEELVIRGTFYLDFDWVKNWDNEVAAMNVNKVGAPYKYPESLIQLQSIWLNFTDFRGVEGMTRRIVEVGQFPEYNDYTTVNRRVNKMKMQFDINDLKELNVATDGTGVKLNMSGEYFQAKYGDGKMKFIKVTISADPFTKEIYKCDVSLEGEGLSEPDTAMIHMAELSAEGHRIVKFWGDGAYDVNELFDFLDHYQIKSAVKIRENAIVDPGGSARRNSEVIQYQKSGYKDWANERKYGHRWPGTEGIISAVKRKFGERVRAKQKINMLLEAKRKFWNYARIRKMAQGAAT